MSSELGLSSNDLLVFSILTGFDYSKGVAGIGVSKALSLVKSLPVATLTESIAYFERQKPSLDFSEVVNLFDLAVNIYCPHFTDDIPPTVIIETFEPLFVKFLNKTINGDFVRSSLREKFFTRSERTAGLSTREQYTAHCLQRRLLSAEKHANRACFISIDMRKF